MNFKTEEVNYVGIEFLLSNNTSDNFILSQQFQSYIKTFQVYFISDIDNLENIYTRCLLFISVHI